MDAFAGVSLSVVKALLTGWRGAKAQTRRAKLQCDFSCLASIAGKMKVRQGLQIRLLIGADQRKCLRRGVAVVRSLLGMLSTQAGQASHLRLGSVC